MKNSLLKHLLKNGESKLEKAFLKEFSTPLHRLNNPDSVCFSELMEKFIHSSARILLLTGEAGSGKSRMTYKWAKSCLQPSATQAPLVIWVPLIDWADRALPDTPTLLEAAGLTSDEIKLLKTNNIPLIWIFDGYDEWGQQQNHHHIQKEFYHEKNKVVITCRTTALLQYNDYRRFFFPIKLRIRTDTYWEYAIQPCSEIEVQNYVLEQIKNFSGYKIYKKKLANCKELQDLMKTPMGVFWVTEALVQILKTTAESELSTLPASELLQRILSKYLSFLYLRQAKKYKKETENLTSLEKKLSDHAIYIATCVKEAPGSCIIYRGSYFNNPSSEEEKMLTLGARCFGDKVTPLWQQLGLIIQKNHSYYFQHPCLQEYLSTCQSSSANTINSQLPRGLPQGQNRNIFYEKDLEDGLIRSLAERISKNSVLQQRLFDYIEASKLDPKEARTAANAITILNRAGVSFSGRDFRGIRIPDADLRGAICDHTQFDNADLSGVKWDEAYLRGACFSGSQWENAIINQRPQWTGHRSAINALAVTTQLSVGYVVSGSDDGSWIIWDAKTGVPLIREHLHKSVITHLVYHPEGKELISVGADGEIYRWIADTKLSYLCWHRSNEEEIISACEVDFKYACLFLSTNNQLCAIKPSNPTDENFSSISWNHLQHNSYNIAVNKIKVLVLHCSEDILYAGQSDGILTSIQKTTGRKLAAWEISKVSITCMRLSEDGKRLVIGDAAGIIIIWDTIRNQSIQTINTHLGSIKALCFVHDKIVTAGSDNKIKYWSKNGELLHETKRQQSNILALAFLSDEENSLLLSAGADRNIRTQHLNISKNSELLLPSSTLKSSKGEDFPILNLISLPNNRVLSINQQGQCVVRDAMTGALWKKWPENLLPPFYRMHTDGIAGKLRITSIDSSDQTNLVNHSQLMPISVCAALSIDQGHWIIVGCSDGSLRILNYQGNMLGTSIAAHASPVTAILHHEKKYIISADQSGQIMGWQLRLDIQENEENKCLLLLWTSQSRLVLSNAFFENVQGLEPYYVRLFSQLGALNPETAQLDLYNALLMHQTEEVKKLLDYYPHLIDTILVLEDRKTTWQLACQYSPWTIIEICLNSKNFDARRASASILEKPDDPYNPLFLALKYNNWETVYALLEYLGLSQAAISQLGWHRNPRVMPEMTRFLADACKSQDPDSSRMIRYLLLLGVDPNASAVDGRTPLMYVGNTEGYFEEIASLLREYGADLEKRDYSGNTTLLHAAAHGQTHYISWLLNKAVVDAQATNREGNDALLCAVYGDHLDTAEILLQNEHYMGRKTRTEKILEGIKAALKHGKSDIRYQAEAVQALSVLMDLIPPDTGNSYVLNADTMKLNLLGMQLLGRALKQKEQPRITKLVLSNNGLRQPACQELKELIPKLAALKELNLSSNLLNDADILSLLEEIEKKERVTGDLFVLDISRNDNLTENGLSRIREICNRLAIQCKCDNKNSTLSIPVSRPMSVAQVTARQGIFGSFGTSAPTTDSFSLISPRVS